MFLAAEKSSKFGSKIDSVFYPFDKRHLSKADVFCYYKDMNIQTHNQFLLQQKLTLLINRYEYFLYDNDIKGEQIAFAEQKRFAFKEAITVWTNDSRAEVLFNVKAEKILDIHGKFIVKDSQDNLIGYCRKAFKASLLRSTWEVYDAQDHLLFIVKERSHGMAIFRRLAQFIPYLSDIAPFFPFNFVYEKDGKVVGHHTRTWGRLADQYKQSLDNELGSVDRRLILALGILLDALQDR